MIFRDRCGSFAEHDRQIAPGHVRCRRQTVHTGSHARGPGPERRTRPQPNAPPPGRDAPPVHCSTSVAAIGLVGSMHHPIVPSQDAAGRMVPAGPCGPALARSPRSLRVAPHRRVLFTGPVRTWCNRRRSFGRHALSLPSHPPRKMKMPFAASFMPAPHPTPATRCGTDAPSAPPPCAPPSHSARRARSTPHRDGLPVRFPRRARLHRPHLHKPRR